MGTGAFDTTFDTAIVDLDGTLVDSTYHHVLAWSQAFAQVGVTVESWRLHRHIGMGGDRFVEAVTNSAVEKSVGDTLRSLWKHNYDVLLRYVRPLDGAHELLKELARHKLKVVVASSGDPRHTKRALRLLRLEQSPPVVDANDAEESKPAPDLLQAAMHKVEGTRAVMIGDTAWDIEAARRCDVPSLVVGTGGVDRSELQGAAAIFATPRDLANELDTALQRASSQHRDPSEPSPTP
jgi:HAD superfamily hydrolase (TIGR01549 family)